MNHQTLSNLALEYSIAYNDYARQTWNQQGDIMIFSATPFVQGVGLAIVLD